MSTQNGFSGILTKEFLEDRYVKRGMGIVEIGKEAGCTSPTIARHLRAHQIPIRTRGKPARDLSKEKFGLLKPIKDLGRYSTKDRMHRWLCRCDCGALTEVIGTQMAKGIVRSCGCLLRRGGPDSAKWRGGRLIPGAYWSRLRCSADARGIEFDLEIAGAEESLVAQEHKCALSGLPIGFGARARSDTTASLDRTDNDGGYSSGNIRWLHKDINRMKWAHSDRYFIRLCCAVADYVRREHPDWLKDEE
jgi:hypothetical protein